MKIIKLHEQENSQIVLRFLESMGSSKKTFRYFETRSIAAVERHEVTLIGLMENEPVAYGHLDKEDGKVWLGIAVIESHCGKGLGKAMLAELLRIADEINEPIHLTVDESNQMAAKLYERHGFKLIDRPKESVLHYKRGN